MGQQATDLIWIPIDRIFSIIFSFFHSACVCVWERVLSDEKNKIINTIIRFSHSCSIRNEYCGQFSIHITQQHTHNFMINIADTFIAGFFLAPFMSRFFLFAGAREQSEKNFEYQNKEKKWTTHTRARATISLTALISPTQYPYLLNGSRTLYRVPLIYAAAAAVLLTEQCSVIAVSIFTDLITNPVQIQ